MRLGSVFDSPVDTSDNVQGGNLLRKLPIDGLRSVKSRIENTVGGVFAKENGTLHDRKTPRKLENRRKPFRHSPFPAPHLPFAAIFHRSLRIAWDDQDGALPS